MRVEVKVVKYPDPGPYHPGTAHVYIDGKLYAKLRTHEEFVVETSEEFTVRTILPPLTSTKPSV